MNERKKHTLLHCVELSRPTHYSPQTKEKLIKKKLYLSLIIIIMASSKILFLNSFLERRKKNNKKKGNNNNKKDYDLDLVKAAAWAWYQRGSGSEGNNNKGLMNEFDVTTTTRTTHQRTSTRPPSRYKLEAMKRMELNDNHHKEEEEEANNNKGHRKKKNSLLLDAYEVQSISRQIDSHIIIESNKNNTSSSTSLMMGMNKKKNKKEKTKGTWLIHGAVCGRGEDVVDPATSVMIGGCGGQQPNRVR
ncbi:uncharacterized protein LOC107457918 [Arachis duranensis]|uniref:Uncharacterized protein LOC107457918 n=1 Tax=Arachis duranensis TaxID=130453 RepID=A0A6P4BJT3_ARADU|nr:uncharacterized protein LOC107457918 [Arachis duranensis]